MSKVTLEEIVFDTWHGVEQFFSVMVSSLEFSCVDEVEGAYHKVNPSGGAGANNAIHDASTLQSFGSKKLKKVFKEYRAERYPVTKEAFETSQMFTRNLGKNMLAAYVRGMMKHRPVWLWKMILSRMHSNRVQASFLPLVADAAPVKPSYQHSLHKTLAIHRELAQNLAAMTNDPVAV
ncbi:hypothetical protein BGZ82_002845 [Podila clonocystis]|nr:hypothetical protein BGZ82_002845 [Podila clonocystis]